MSVLIRYVILAAMAVALVAVVWHGPGDRAGATSPGTPTPAGCGALVDGGTPIASPEADTASPVASESGAQVDLATFVDALEERDVRVETTEPIEQPFFNAEQVTRLVISGGPLSGPAELQVYEYADPATLESDARQVTPDGNLNTVMITWIADPHFFCTGQLIVIYLGDDGAAVGLLTELFGPQFAGR